MESKFLPLLMLILLTLQNKITCSNESKHVLVKNEFGNTIVANSSDEKLVDKHFFLNQIFSKYGQNGIMTVEGFEHLLESLGLGRLVLDNFDIKSDKHNKSHDLEDKKNINSSNTALTDKKVKSSLRPLVDISSSASPLEGSTVIPTASHSKNDKSSTSLEEHTHDNTSDIGQVSSIAYTSSQKDSIDVSNEQCLTVGDILHTFEINHSEAIGPSQFLQLCPAIVYELDQHHCSKVPDDIIREDYGDSNDINVSGLVWLYATTAVVVISLSGLVVVAIIPIMQGSFYNLLLQFLVALAVGSLTGDALLHLLPHALESGGHEKHHSNNDQQFPSHHHHHHHHNNHEIDHSHNHNAGKMVWKGLIAVCGILLFFLAERLLAVLCSWRKHQTHHVPSQVKILRGDDIELSRTVGEKLCKHKYNSYGYGYGEATVDMLQDLNDTACDEKDHHNNQKKRSEHEKIEFKSSIEGIERPPKYGEGDQSEHAAHASETSKNNVGVIITEHEHHHHGHSHTHTHAMPTSISAVAWMIVMGDGLHNFSDGLAIGAAFANSITGGLSTAIAVLCHELPHELGDFAVLLKSGMSARQALAYNCLSSVLCFLGMLLGVALGNVENVTSWIFAGAAGMFIYIALVDMIPELNSTSLRPEAQAKLIIFVQLLGMSSGVIIMLLIALYEHDLHNIISD